MNALLDRYLAWYRRGRLSPGAGFLLAAAALFYFPPLLAFLLTYIVLSFLHAAAFGAGPYDAGTRRGRAAAALRAGVFYATLAVGAATALAWTVLLAGRLISGSPIL